MPDWVFLKKSGRDPPIICGHFEQIQGPGIGKNEAPALVTGLNKDIVEK
jgi:hypothetical protein